MLGFGACTALCVLAPRVARAVMRGVVLLLGWLRLRLRRAGCVRRRGGEGSTCAAGCMGCCCAGAEVLGGGMSFNGCVGGSAISSTASVALHGAAACSGAASVLVRVEGARAMLGTWSALVHAACSLPPILCVTFMLQLLLHTVVNHSRAPKQLAA